MNSLQNSILNFSDTLWCLSVILRDASVNPRISDKLNKALNKVIYDNVKLSALFEDAHINDLFTPEVAFYCEAFFDEFVDIEIHLCELEEGDDPEIYHDRTKKLHARMTRIIPKLQALVDEQLEN